MKLYYQSEITLSTKKDLTESNAGIKLPKSMIKEEYFHV
jgi:hypothetical protein